MYFHYKLGDGTGPEVGARRSEFRFCLDLEVSVPSVPWLPGDH